MTLNDFVQYNGRKCSVRLSAKSCLDATFSAIIWHKLNPCEKVILPWYKIAPN